MRCHDKKRLKKVLSKQSLLLRKVTKQFEDAKFITNKFYQQTKAPGIHKLEMSINVVGIMEEVLVDIGGHRKRGISSSSVSKLSSRLTTQGDEMVQMVSSSQQEGLRCLSRNDYGQSMPIYTANHQGILLYLFQLCLKISIILFK